MHTHRRNSVNNNSKGWLKFGLFMSKKRGREARNGTHRKANDFLERNCPLEE